MQLGNNNAEIPVRQGREDNRPGERDSTNGNLNPPQKAYTSQKPLSGEMSSLRSDSPLSFAGGKENKKRTPRLLRETVLWD